MSLVRLNIKSRIELETRVLAAALKQSLEGGDPDGASLAHKQLFYLLKDVGKAQPGSVETIRIADGMPPGLYETAEPAAAEATKSLASESAVEPSTDRSMESKSPAKTLGYDNAGETPPLPFPALRPGFLRHRKRQPSGVRASEHATVLVSDSEIAAAAGSEIIASDSRPVPEAKIVPPQDESLLPVAEPAEGPGGEQEGAHTASASAQRSDTGELTESATRSEQGEPDAGGAGAKYGSSGDDGQLLVVPVLEDWALSQPESESDVAVASVSPDSAARSKPSQDFAPELLLEPVSLSQQSGELQSAPGVVPDMVLEPDGGLNLAPPVAELSVDRAPESRAVERVESSGIYALLGVSQMSAFDEIHTSFLRRVRGILGEIKRNRAVRYDKLPELQKLWIAHDILTDPVTRTDYDFRNLGVRGAPDSIVHPADDQQPQRLGSRTPLRIGELLQCAGLLETAELEIACDMHKAMPEMQFGAFLVKQGFIEERHLEAVLVGQKLLRAGAISVAQFQVAMDLSQSEHRQFGEALVERGYITDSELELALNPPPPVEVPPVLLEIKEATVQPKLREVTTTEFNSRELKPAMPAWKDHLDWGPPEQTSVTPAPEPSTAAAQTPAPDSQKPGLGGLLSTKHLSQPALNNRHAVPSWTDQLDWVSPQAELPPVAQEQAQVEQLASEGSAEPAAVVAQSDAGSGLASPQRLEGRAKLTLSNAVPTWKDQLDWGAPAESETATEFTPEPALQEHQESPVPQSQPVGQFCQSPQIAENETQPESTQIEVLPLGELDRFAPADLSAAPNLVSGPAAAADTVLVPPAESILSYGKMAEAFESDESFVLPPNALPNMAGPATLQTDVSSARTQQPEAEQPGLLAHLAGHLQGQVAADITEPAPLEAEPSLVAASEADEVPTAQLSEVEGALGSVVVEPEEQASLSEPPGASSDEPSAELVSVKSAKKEKRKKPQKDKRKKRK